MAAQGDEIAGGLALLRHIRAPGVSRQADGEAAASETAAAQCRSLRVADPVAGRARHGVRDQRKTAVDGRPGRHLHLRDSELAHAGG